MKASALGSKTVDMSSDVSSDLPAASRSSQHWGDSAADGLRRQLRPRALGPLREAAERPERAPKPPLNVKPHEHALNAERVANLKTGPLSLSEPHPSSPLNPAAVKSGVGRGAIVRRNGALINEFPSKALIRSANKNLQRSISARHPEALAEKNIVRNASITRNFRLASLASARREMADAQKRLMQWRAFSPKDQIQIFSGAQGGLLARLPEHARSEVLIKLAEVVGPHIAGLLEQKQESAALLFRNMVAQHSHLGCVDRPKALTAVAAAAAKILNAEMLDDLHVEIYNRWPPDDDAKPLADQLIGDLHLTHDRGSEFDSLVRFCDRQSAQHRPELFAKLFGQLHHVPDEDLDDAVKVYKNHLLEYPPEEREKLVDATKQMQASLPDGFRQRVENFVHDVDWAVLNRLLPD